MFIRTLNRNNLKKKEFNFINTKKLLFKVNHTKTMIKIEI